MSFTIYSTNITLDFILSGGSFPQPTIYLGLSRADPNTDAAYLDEPVGDGYARVLFTDWILATARAITNNSLVLFGDPSGYWGELTHICAFDGPNPGDNLISYAALSESIIGNTGSTISFEAEEIVFGFEDGYISDYLAGSILGHIFGGSAYSPPANVYIGLPTSEPIQENSGSDIEEPGDAAYSRVNCSSWDATADGETSNQSLITFSKALENWGNLKYSTVLDAIIVGNLLFFGLLGAELDCIPGKIPQFPIGDFVISIDKAA